MTKAITVSEAEWKAAYEAFDIASKPSLSAELMAKLFARHAAQARQAALDEAAEPWADFHGDLPDYNHPLRCVFESGIEYAIELLAKMLSVDDWQICDGSETFDGDLGGTMLNIVLAAMPTDEDGEPIGPRELRAVLSATPTPAPIDNEALVEEVARAIDDLPMRSWQAHYDFCVGQGDDHDKAKRYADQTHGADIEKVHERARAVLALPSIAKPDDKYRLLLLDLLATIHRDGGHKTQEIGIKLAHEQAVRISCERFAATSALVEEVIGALEKGASYLDAACSLLGDCEISFYRTWLEHPQTIRATLAKLKEGRA